MNEAEVIRSAERDPLPVVLALLENAKNDQMTIRDLEYQLKMAEDKYTATYKDTYWTSNQMAGIVILCALVFSFIGLMMGIYW
jgi:hypothetical protein